MMHDFFIIVTCLILSAFFSGMEIAFLSANRLRIELDKKQGHFSSIIISKFINNPSIYITTILIVNNVVLVMFGIYMPHLLDPMLSFFHFSGFMLILIQTLLSTILILITAEFLPKAIFRLVPNSSLRTFSLPLYFFYLLFYPFSKVIISISNFFIKVLFGHKSKNQEELTQMFSKLDLDHFMQMEQNTHKINVLDHEIKFFKNALDFSSIKVRDCMVQRPDIIAIDENETIDELRQAFIETGFSKIVVYSTNIDNITGYVSSKDIFKNPKTIKAKLIAPPIVPGTMTVNKLLQKMLKDRKSLAVVVDEFGGTSGIITIEDIIEEIFGDIEDEHDTVDVIAKQLSDSAFVFSAKATIDYLNEQFQLNIPESDNYDTLAGYIFHQLGRIPAVSEKFSIENYSFKIIKARNNRLDLIYMKKEEE